MEKGITLIALGVVLAAVGTGLLVGRPFAT